MNSLFVIPIFSIRKSSRGFLKYVKNRTAVTIVRRIYLLPPDNTQAADIIEEDKIKYAVLVFDLIKKRLKKGKNGYDCSYQSRVPFLT